MKDISLKGKFRWLMVIVVLLAGIQFIKTKMDNPPVTEDLNAPADVKKILTNACYDCHSNETKLSWFDKIAPGSWIVAADVRNGRKALNFSEWNYLTKAQQSGILFESLNHIQFHVMPLPRYLFLHSSARINSADVSLLKSFLNTLRKQQNDDTTVLNNWNNQYNNWIKKGTAITDIKAAPNGIDFMPEYKNWVVISVTERFDDGKLRIITGNNVAVNAIKSHQTNPWPKGSAFAKIAWTQVSDSNGNTRAGEFKQVAFMIKDNDKYNSTQSWGYAQWVKGVQLIPYGKNALFTTECMGCHQPMKDNDFVFTVPLDFSIGYEEENKVICSLADKKLHTISILYGNNVAVNFARTHTGNNYPKGSVLKFVTWDQQPDPHWYGANIPRSVKSVEQIYFNSQDNGRSRSTYVLSQGNVKENANDRLNFILNLHASVMP